MTNIILLARNTFREAIRNKVLYSFVGFSFVFMIASIFMGEVTIGEKVKIIKDLGLSSIQLFGIFIAIFVGIGLIYKEIDKRTIYTIITRPISRAEFIIGKYFGLVFTLFILTLVMTCFFLAIVFYYSHIFEWMLLVPIVFIFIELMVITAMSIFFSSYASPFLSALLTLLFFVTGHMTYQLRSFSKSYGNIYETIMSVAYYVLPNLENFNFKSRIVHKLPISSNELIFSFGYGLLWIFTLIMIASLIFRKRDFK